MLGMPNYILSFMKKGLFLTFFLWIAGCSSTKVINEPVELHLFKSDVLVKQLWMTSPDNGVGDQFLQLTPFILDDNLYSVNTSGVVSVYNRFTGKRIWKKSSHQQVLAGLGGDQKQLYLSNDNGELVALNRQNGDVVWKTPLSSEVVSQPSSNGQIVVAQTVDGKMFAMNAETGKVKWRYDSIAPILSVRGASRAYIDSEKTISGFSNGEVVALANNDGHVLWNFAVGVPKGKTELERLVDIDGKITVDNDKVFAVSYQGKLSVLDAVSGRELWSVPASSYGTASRGLDHVYISSSEGEVQSLSLSAQTQVWQQDKLKFRQLTAPVVLGNTVVVADYKGFIHFLSQIDGHLKARARLDVDGVNSPLIVQDKILYVQGNSGAIAAYQLIQY